jgi:hypothetical protein
MPPAVSSPRRQHGPSPPAFSAPRARYAAWVMRRSSMGSTIRLRRTSSERGTYGRYRESGRGGRHLHRRRLRIRGPRVQEASEDPAVCSRLGHGHRRGLRLAGGTAIPAVTRATPSCRTRWRGLSRGREDGRVGVGGRETWRRGSARRSCCSTISSTRQRPEPDSSPVRPARR